MIMATIPGTLVINKGNNISEVVDLSTSPIISSSNLRVNPLPTISIIHLCTFGSAPTMNAVNYISPNKNYLTILHCSAPQFINLTAMGMGWPHRTPVGQLTNRYIYIHISTLYKHLAIPFSLCPTWLKWYFL